MGTSVSMMMTYCACSSLGSLCNACLGTTAAGTTGRKRSVLLLALAIVFALWFQYSVGPSIVQETGWIWKTYRLIPGMGKMVFAGWKQGCEDYEGDLLSQCAGRAGVFRPTFLAMVFFVSSAIATKFVPSLNREAWPAKFGIYFFALFICMFIPNGPLFAGFFLWFARIFAGFFVVLQQIILIDVAYNWNDDWVERSDAADRLSYGSGGLWLQAIIGTAVSFYIAVIVGISMLYKYFGDCTENNWVITLTLLGCLTMTGLQLSGEDGSLLTSSVMSIYSVYLAYTIVAKNPNGECNPQLGHNDVWGIVVGLTLTAISLIWTGWSFSAEYRLNVESVQSTKPVTAPQAPQGAALNLDVPLIDEEQAPTTGMVLDEAETRTTGGGDLWKLNVVMALISCFVAMTLTDFGTLQELNENMNAANPTAGRVNMAILGISQWLAIGLYIWTLIAPRVFPDRDFS